MNKVAQITIYFWIIKICATTLGETAGDLLSMTLGIGYALSSLILIGVFLVLLLSQIFSKQFNPWLYWAVVLCTSTVGTTISDYMDRTLGLGYANGSLLLMGSLIAMLWIWNYCEGNVSVHYINSGRAEIFYWVTILFSNTLGTALGDFIADDSGLGFLGGASLIAGLLVCVVIANYFTSLSKTMLFWIAFVLTRPFGAAFGDLMTKPEAKGGLNLGTIGSSAVLFAMLVSVLLYSNKREQRA